MNENEIMKLLEPINYGWVDKNGITHIGDFETFSDDYRLQSPEEVLKNKVGVCWDQVELERVYFSNFEEVKTYFIVHYDGGKCPTHTFLTYKKNNKYYWFEHSWYKYNGIHEYSTIDELLQDVRTKFIVTELNNTYDPENLVVHEYEQPQYHLTVQEFFDHCDSGKFIKVS